MSRKLKGTLFILFIIGNLALTQNVAEAIEFFK